MKNVHVRRISGIKGPEPTIPSYAYSRATIHDARCEMPLNDKSFQRCLSYIDRLARQAESEVYGPAVIYMKELMHALSCAYVYALEDGNVLLAVSLPGVISRLNKAYREYGKGIKINPSPRYVYNRFVEYFYRGYFWDGGNLKRIRPSWHGKKKLPAVVNIDGWMEIIKTVLQDNYSEPSQVAIFRPLLKSHKAVYAQNPEKEIPLSEDMVCYQWDQVFKKIRNAWRGLAKRHSPKKPKV